MELIKKFQFNKVKPTLSETRKTHSNENQIVNYANRDVDNYIKND